MTERGRRIEYTLGTSPLVTLEAHPLAKNLSENKENQLQGYWVGEDLDITEVRSKDNGFSGKLIIPHGYFGEQYDIAQEFLLATFLTSTQQFSARSRLAQAGIYPQFHKISLDTETHDLMVDVSTLPVHDKRFVNVPESFSLGRLYAASMSRNLKGQDLKEFVDSTGMDYLLNPDQEGVAVSMTVPIVKFFQIGVEKIDLENVLNVSSGKREGKRELDEALGLLEIPMGKLNGRFVLGETGRLRVPDDKKLLIVPGVDESTGIHLPSQVIDACDWPIRTEQLITSPADYQGAVEFFVYNSGK
jgi:hypothetical protein